MIYNQSFQNDSSGVRLDAAIVSRFPTTTRAFVREAIESGSVLVRDRAAPKGLNLPVGGRAAPKGLNLPVGGRAAPKGLKLCGGETIEIRELAEAADNVVCADASVRAPCVFEDDALLAYDKPAGMPVQPLTRTETGTLMNGVVARHPECRPLGDRPLLAGAVHRIDADTSGLVLVARTAAAFENLRAQFAAQTVEKTYLALVEGSVAVGATLEHDLIHDPTLPFCRMIDIRGRKGAGLRARGAGQEARGEKALHAVTRYTPIGHVTVENEERTLLEVKIFTGVTHQIRAQLALAGLHIVNDRLYGAFAVENQTGHCLHALAAKFTHPLSGVPVEIRTPEPAWADLRA